MTNDLLWLKDWYWAHREAVRVSLVVGPAILAQVALALWTVRRLRELSHMRERMSRLADGLALLTDTTETGLATLIREVERLGRRKETTRTATRANVSKRVLLAARSGEGVERIAETESLSESEVRLHLTLAGKKDPGVGLGA